MQAGKQHIPDLVQPEIDDARIQVATLIGLADGPGLGELCLPLL